MKILDLSKYIQLVQEYPSYKIGILGKDVNGLVGYKKGEIILFRPYSTNECKGIMSFNEMQNHIRHCTIEMPSLRYFTKESNVSTIRTVVGVPLEYIETEISI